MGRYVLIGIERSEEEVLGSPINPVSVPRHLLLTNPYRKLLRNGASDTFTFANIDSIVNGKAKTVTVTAQQTEYFEREYNVIRDIKQFMQDPKEPGPLDRYGSTNLPYNQPMVIIYKIKGGGSLCLDVEGKLYNLSNEDVLDYANTYGIANAIVQRGTGSNSIRIKGRAMGIPTITVNQAQQICTATASSNGTNSSLINYKKKMEFLGIKASIDLDNSILLNYESGNYSGRLLIPPVSIIGRYAFDDVKADEIELPSSIRTITNYAFWKAEVKKLILSHDIENVEQNTWSDFGLCFRKLDCVHIGANFSNKELLKDILLSNEIVHIEVSSDNKWFEVQDNVVYTSGKKQIVGYARNRAAKEYIMPHEVEGTLGPRSIYTGPNLQMLRISDNIEYIEPNAIYCASELKIIELGKGIRYICPGAIRRCDHLEKIIVNSNIELRPNVHFVSIAENDDKALKNVQIIYNGKKPHQFI